jgi:hypothetical protein
MKNIDFLPEVYRQRTAQRHARIWWGIVVMIFSVAIGSTAAAQHLLRRSIQRQIDELAEDFDRSQEQVQRLSKLQVENRAAGELAGLVTYLEQPWPRTRLLSEAIAPLPEAIHLSDLQFSEEDVVRATVEEMGPRRRNRQVEQQPRKLSPAQSDLETLRRLHDYKRPVIEITGSVADIAVVHEYISTVGRSPLVSRCELKSAEAPPTGTGDKTTRFAVRLWFKPSLGQPNFDEAKPAPGAPLRVAQGGTAP